MMNIKNNFISAKSYILLIAIISLSFIVVLVLPTSVRATHTEVHCSDLLVDDSERAEKDYLMCINNVREAEASGESTTEQLEQSELELQESNNAIANVKSNPIYYDLLLTFINFLTAGIGLVVTTLVVVGGIQYMTAGGNPQKTQAAITRISNALIGLVLYIFMFAILQWLIPGGLFG